MATPHYTDTAGRQRTVTVTAGTALAIQRDTGINLFDLIDPELATLRRLHTDLELLVDCLWHAASHPPEETPTEFAATLAGAALEDALRALLDALAFFLPPRSAATLTAIRRKADALTETMQTALLQQLQQIEDTDGRAPTAPRSSCTTPRPADSTPDPTRSGNWPPPPPTPKPWPTTTPPLYSAPSAPPTTNDTTPRTSTPTASAPTTTTPPAATPPSDTCGASPCFRPTNAQPCWPACAPKENSEGPAP